MKVGELYSVMCIIFATNFKGAISKENFEKLASKWIIINENPENKNGQELWAGVKNSDYEGICADFENLKEAFDMSYFKLISASEVSVFYERCRFKKPFADLPDTHAANMLGLLAMIFKQDTNEKSHNILGEYLTNFIMPSLRGLAGHLQINAKSDYYKAFGYFLADFCVVVKNSLGLKI